METGTSNNAITVETTVKAPIEKVWQVWTSPSHITRWNAASDDWHTPYAENDLREGGKFSSRMEARDKSMGFDFNGVYTSVEKHKKIAYVMEDGRKVNIRFSAEGENTRVTETFDPESMNSAEMQKAGWQAILDNFRKYTETLPDTAKMQFGIRINAPAMKVYKIMTDSESYRTWTAVFNPSSRFEGSWEKGSKICFIGTDEQGQTGGMVSRIAENIPGKFISIEHLGILKGREEITSGAEVDGWAGAHENYTFTDEHGDTFLEVDMDVNDQFRSYFEETWPRALEMIKQLCESK